MHRVTWICLEDPGGSLGADYRVQVSHDGRGAIHEDRKYAELVFESHMQFDNRTGKDIPHPGRERSIPCEHDVDFVRVRVLMVRREPLHLAPASKLQVPWTTYSVPGFCSRDTNPRTRETYEYSVNDYCGDFWIETSPPTSNF